MMKFYHEERERKGNYFSVCESHPLAIKTVFHTVFEKSISLPKG